MNHETLGIGVVAYADTAQAENAFVRLARRQMELLKDSRLFASEYPKNLDRGLAPIHNFNRTLNQNYQSIQRFNHEVRNLTNQLNSLVMTGVAVSMTGVSFMNFGRQVTNFFKEAVDQATKFEKTMKEIEFLGGLRGQVKEMKQIQDEIMRIGVSLPTTNQKVAEGMVEAMRAGFNKDEALKLAPIMSEMAFLSFDKMDEAESLKMMNAWLKTTGKNVDYARTAFDKFAKTADLFTTDLDGINRSIQSTRAAFDTLELGRQEKGEESFLTLIGMMSTQYTDRAAGQMINSFARGLTQAFGSKPTSNRGELWAALGIDYEKEDDILETLVKISKRSRELWGDTKARQEKLIDLFGVEGLPVLQMIEKFERSGENIFQLRDAIRDSSEYSEEYMKHIMKTSYGTQKILEGTRETLKTLIGLSILETVNKVLWGFSRVLERIANFARNHPQITKFVSLLVLSVGVLSTLTGGALLVSGAFLAMYGSIASAITALGRLNATEELMEKGFKNLRSILNYSVIGPMKSTILSMTKMAIASGLLYLAWKHDFMGMKTHTMNLFNSFKQGRKLADELFSKDMSWEQFMEIRSKKDPLTQWFTDKFVKAKALWQLLKGLWKDGVITADDVGGVDEFNRLYKIWQETGMLEIADRILDWKTNIEAFWEGFMKGGEIAKEFIYPLFRAIGDILVWIYDVAVWIGERFGFIKKDAEGLAPKFEKIGTVLGTIVGLAGGALLAFKAWRITLGPIVSLLSKVIGFGIRGGGRIFGWVGNLFGKGGKGGKGGPPGGGIGGFFSKQKEKIGGGLADKTKRTVAKGLFLDRVFPSIFSKDGGVKNPANLNPEPTSRVELRKQKRMDRFHEWAWRQTLPTEGGRNKRRLLDSLPDYRTYKQRSQFGPIKGAKGVQIRTIQSKTIGGILKDVLFGRRIDSSISKTGRHSYRQINEHGVPVSRNVKPENYRFMNRKGEVRTGRGLLTGNLFYRGARAVGQKAMDTPLGQHARMMATYMSGSVKDSALLRNVKRGTKISTYETTGVEGAVPGQKHIVRERGGLIGGSFDTFFGSKTYDREGKYVGRTKTDAKGQRSFKARGKLSKAMGFGGQALGGLFNAVKTQGPKAGKLLLKGLLAPLKIGFRAIPIIGQLLLAWDIISAVWSNWDSIKAGAAKAWEWIKTTAVKVWEWLKSSAVPSMWTAVKALGAWAWNGIKSLASLTWEWIKTKANQIWEAITTYAKNKISSWKQAAIGMWDAIRDKAALIWESITTTIKTKVAAWKNEIGRVWDGLVSSFETAWGTVKEYAAKNPITRTVNWVSDKVTNIFNNGTNKQPSKKGKAKGHRTGLYNVDRENYPALLHRGEMVLTRREAQLLRAMSGTNSIYDTLMDLKDEQAEGMRTGGDVKGRHSIKSIQPNVVTVPQPTKSGGGGGNVNITIPKIEVVVNNPTDEKEIERMVDMIATKLKRKIELENLRNYRPARGY